MDEKCLRILELDKILEALSARAQSGMGKELCRSLRPLLERNDILLAQRETSEAVSFILRKGSLPLGGISDIREALRRVCVGGVLSIPELRNVGEFLYVCGKVVKYGRHEDKSEYYERLDPRFAAVVPVSALERELARCIANETALNDDASGALYDIRRKIRQAGDKIKDQLNTIIHSAAYKNTLQDSVVTMRNGRYCVPVKSEARGSFPGMLHDQSSTGATVFIEPASVVSLNNKIRELLSDEQAEVDKILRGLSEQVFEVSAELERNLDTLSFLDFVFAKAELSLAQGGVEPVFNERGFVNIVKGRHPLLRRETLVPLDIYLGGDFQTLMITGPNTGGKTVALKTLGLFSLMGQAGLHIPAKERSELAIFDNIFADIGDEQSIEQSLSTFSGHMSNIVSILQHVTSHSLVLLDELGAGTDPVEGAALAIAVIKRLREVHALCAVTTHYSELKVYALSEDGVENAACEFDVETLRPTFKLLIGIPGKSNAFAISRRLGLPESVIDAAKALISGEGERLEDVIADLEISKKTAVIEQDRAEQYRREAEKMKREYEEQREKITGQRDKLILEARLEARGILDKARTEAGEIIKEMLRLQAAGTNFKELEENRKRLLESLENADKSIAEQKAPKKALKPIERPLRAGDKVFVHSMNIAGQIAAPPDSAGNVIVRAGSMKLKVSAADLSLDETKAKAESVVVSSKNVSKALAISPEIDLRGMTVSEALEAVDKYLDDAALSGLDRVGIIHGKGTGALRAAVTEHLRRHPHIRAFRLGSFGEGETGVTIAEIK